MQISVDLMLETNGLNQTLSYLAHKFEVDRIQTLKGNPEVIKTQYRDFKVEASFLQNFKRVSFFYPWGWKNLKENSDYLGLSTGLPRKDSRLIYFLDWCSLKGPLLSYSQKYRKEILQNHPHLIWASHALKERAQEDLGCQLSGEVIYPYVNVQNFSPQKEQGQEVVIFDPLNQLEKEETLKTMPGCQGRRFEIYRKAKHFIDLSQDHFPLYCLEALASGVNAFREDSASNREFLSDGHVLSNLKEKVDQLQDSTMAPAELRRQSLKFTELKAKRKWEEILSQFASV